MNTVDVTGNHNVFRYCPFCSSSDPYQPVGKQTNSSTEYIKCTQCRKTIKLICSDSRYQYMNVIYPVGSKKVCSKCPNGQIQFDFCMTCKCSAVPAGTTAKMVKIF